MKKLKSTILAFSTLLCFSSCDITYYVAVNNYGQKNKVTVNYNNSQTSAWHDSDTLSAERLDKSSDTLLTRTNIDSTTYSFVIPAHHQVELQPKSLGTPIRSVTFQADNDSTITVNFWNNDWKQLKRKGVIETKPFFLFTHTILISKK